MPSPHTELDTKIQRVGDATEGKSDVDYLILTDSGAHGWVSRPEQATSFTWREACLFCIAFAKDDLVGYYPVRRDMLPRNMQGRWA